MAKMQPLATPSNAVISRVSGFKKMKKCNRFCNPYATPMQPLATPCNPYATPATFCNP